MCLYSKEKLVGREVERKRGVRDDIKAFSQTKISNKVSCREVRSSRKNSVSKAKMIRSSVLVVASLNAFE